MATRIHPKKSTKSHPKMSTKCHPKRTSRGQKCPRNVTKSVHEVSPLLSTRCHLLCPWDVCHPDFTVKWQNVYSTSPSMRSNGSKRWPVVWTICNSKNLLALTNLPTPRYLFLECIVVNSGPHHKKEMANWSWPDQILSKCIFVLLPCASLSQRRKDKKAKQCDSITFRAVRQSQL